MRNRRTIIFLFLLALLVVAALAIPAVLQAVPDRYVMRLPEPLQQLGVPDDPDSPILPTLAPISNSDVGALLGTTAVAQPTAASIPPTLTPIPVAGQTAATATPFVPTATPSPVPTTEPIPANARLEGFTHQFQDWNNCGPATMAMTLSFFDLNVTQYDTAAILKPNPEDRNVNPYEMVDYVQEQTPFIALNRVNGNAETIKRLVANDIPVIVEIGIEPPGEFRWLGWYGHYLLVVAYDDALQQFWVFDSWFGTSETPMENAHISGRILTYEALARDWPHFNRNYIAIYRPEQAETVARIVGSDMDDDVMWQRALQQTQLEASRNPNDAFTWFNVGTNYNAVGDYEKAAAAFDQALAIGLPWRMLWYQFGPYEAYYQVGRYQDVITLADITLKDRPYFEESFYYKGLSLAALGDMRAAQENLENAVQFNPNFDPAAQALAQLQESG